MPNIILQSSFRPAEAPFSNLPFGVRCAGQFRIEPQYTSTDKKLDFLQFFWCTRGSGFIEINGRRRVLRQHQVALYYPDMRHYWYSDRQAWEFYWFGLEGPFALSLPAAFGLEADIYYAGPAPVKLFDRLFPLVRQLTQQAELEACVTAFLIISRAAGKLADQTDEVVNTAVECIHKQYTSPDLNVKTLSAALKIRRAVLSARFHARLGISPGAYIKRLRIQRALSLLKHTRLSIATISSRCGYTDFHYFSRVIHRITSKSPLQIRKI